MIEAAPSPQHRALFALCGLCGLRIAEALSVGLDNIDLERGTLCVRGKGDRERAVPLTAEAFTAILPAVAMAGRAPCVGLSDRGARAAVTAVGLRVLGHHVASHDLRMTFGTAVNDRYGLRVAQELLGHANSTTTEGYTMVSVTAMRQAVEGL